MSTVAYLNPFVPPEWIAAFGWRPRWLRLGRAGRTAWAAGHRGLCPYAGAMIERLLATEVPRAVVLTTTCDPMRYAAAVLEAHGGPPAFLLNVPSTWQSPAASRLYQDELMRLGRFLVALGGRQPSPELLRETLLRYDEARAAARDNWLVRTAADYAELLEALRGDGRPPNLPRSDSPSEDLPDSHETGYRIPGDGPISHDARSGPRPFHGPAIPLAILGGPLLEDDLVLFDLVTSRGGQIVLDGSEGGWRTLPAPLDREVLAVDPLDALRRAYFDAIPDVFRRPNTAVFEWLRREVTARGVRGILLRRHVFCDLWHAEVERLRAAAGVSVLDLDTLHAEDGSAAAALGRIEAFLEMLGGDHPPRDPARMA